MKNIHNRLKELIKSSETLVILPAESKALLERELLVLPDKDIKDLIRVFEAEKDELKKLDEDALADAGKFKKLTTDVVMAGQGLKKALIRSRENDDKQKERHVEEDLLNDLDAV
jgi:hypothetical protein